MKLYTKLILSLFIICPYLTFQILFIQVFKLLLKIIFDDKLSDLLFIIVLSSYFTIFLVSLILSSLEILLIEIFSGLLILFASFIYYRPFSLERKEYIDYFPTFDIIYVLVIGLGIFIHGFITICKKIKKAKYPSSYNENLLIFDQEEPINMISTSGVNDQSVFVFECNRIGFKNTFFFF